MKPVRLCTLFYLYLVGAAFAQFGYYRSGAGYKLVGSSFGLLGLNATYDYVVSRALAKTAYM